MEETRSIEIEGKERDRFVTERMKGRKREGRRGYRDGCIGKDREKGDRRRRGS